MCVCVCVCVCARARVSEWVGVWVVRGGTHVGKQAHQGWKQQGKTQNKEGLKMPSYLLFWCCCRSAPAPVCCVKASCFIYPCCACGLNLRVLRWLNRLSGSQPRVAQS